MDITEIKEKFNKQFGRLDSTKYSSSKFGGMITQLKVTEEVWSFIESLLKQVERETREEMAKEVNIDWSKTDKKLRKKKVVIHILK